MRIRIRLHGFIVRLSSSQPLIYVDPSPSCVFDADLEPAFHPDADLDPASHANSYTDPQHCYKQMYGTIIKDDLTFFAGIRHSKPRNR
jgi:hypothetical protein